MTPSDDFWVSLRRAQDEVLRGSSAVRTARDQMPLRAPERRRRWPRAVVLAAAAVVLLLGGLALLRAEPERLAFRVGSSEAEGRPGEWLAAEHQGLPLRFSDGTVLRLDAGSRARVVGLDADGAHVVIEHGRTSADVVHRRKSRWRLDVGPFQVSVIGTRFDLDWDPASQELEILLRAGTVQVAGAFLKQPVVVSQGQRLVLSCREARAELGQFGASNGRTDAGPPQNPEPTSPYIPALPAPSAAEPRPQAAARSEAPSAAEPTWQALAARGKYREALDLVVGLGFEAECRRASGRDRVVLGDTARLSGDTARAKFAYLAARAQPEAAGRAAYGLGLIAFDQQRDFAAAARWFRVYLDERPGGALRREALGRLMEALQRVGDGAGAKAAAQQYLSSYPDGSYARLARELVSR